MWINNSLIINPFIAINDRTHISCWYDLVKKEFYHHLFQPHVLIHNIAYRMKKYLSYGLESWSIADSAALHVANGNELIIENIIVSLLSSHSTLELKYIWSTVYLMITLLTDLLQKMGQTDGKEDTRRKNRRKREGIRWILSMSHGFLPL